VTEAAGWLRRLEPMVRPDGVVPSSTVRASDDADADPFADVLARHSASPPTDAESDIAEDETVRPAANAAARPGLDRIENASLRAMLAAFDP